MEMELKRIANEANGRMTLIFYLRQFASFEKFAPFAIKYPLRQLHKFWLNIQTGTDDTIKL
jgi:hypothetical protein